MLFKHFMCTVYQLFYDERLNKQSVPVNGLCVSWLCVLSFTVELKEVFELQLIYSTQKISK